MHHCFPPVTRQDTRLLLLGSLPGAVSLARRQLGSDFWEDSSLGIAL